VWTESTLDGDADGARKTKFLKLMGAAKSTKGAAAAAKPTAPPPRAHGDAVKEELERQFEESRMHTFAGRGAGLGMYSLEPEPHPRKT
jgi:hypothetical protein